MKKKTIQITENDLRKLRTAISEAEISGYRNSVYIQQLKGELDRAKIVDPKKIPADVITMNSRVILIDESNQDEMELKLVFPEEGTKEENNVSVLAPIGTAMIGYRTGDIFEWDLPTGKTKLRVEKILYQPEASGIYD